MSYTTLPRFPTERNAQLEKWNFEKNSSFAIINIDIIVWRKHINFVQKKAI